MSDPSRNDAPSPPVPAGAPPRDEALAVALEAAREAARIHRERAGGDLGVDTKSSRTDLVTLVDRESEERIREVLLGAFPDHVVLGEEGGQSGDARCRWIVDPLDGTVNYAHGFPFYCTSIALEVDGTVEVGVVLDSARGDLFTATRGGGAFLDGEPIEVTAEADPADALLATGFAYDPDRLADNLAVFARVVPAVRAVRRPGAAALDLCCVACGRLDGFWELNLKPWDVAAGALIVREAGGTVTGAAGEPHRIEGPAIVASNGRLHGKLVDLLDLGSVLA